MEMDMDTSDSSNDRSIAIGSGETASASWAKQWTAVNEVEMHVEAIQSLVKGQKDILKKLGSQVNNENSGELENSVFLSDVSCHVEKIRKVINDEGKSSISLAASPLSLSYNANQAEDVVAVVEKALKNSVVLRTIMNNLDTRDLLRCRLVTKSWKEEADIQLLSGRPGIRRGRLDFWWQEVEKNYQHRRGTLKEFTESCCESPFSKFLCAAFDFFLYNTNIDSEQTEADLVNFFTKYGHHIKKLGLYRATNSESVFKILHKIIFEWTPNLKSLTLSDDVEEDNHQQMSQTEDCGPQTSTLSLENLQELKLASIDDDLIPCERSKQLVSRILASAPNLKRISDLDLKFTKEIVASGKIRAVYSTDLECDSSLSRFEEFSQARPQVTRLQLDLDFHEQNSSYADFFPSFQLVLESSRRTLKTLQLNHRLHVNIECFDSTKMVILYKGFRFAVPILENLRQLGVCKWKPFVGCAGQIFRPSSLFLVLFPRLKRLSLSEDVNPHERIEDPFTNTLNSSPTVKNLEIVADGKSLFHIEWIPEARILYPNVRVLDLWIQNNWMELPQICSSIWKSWNDSSLEDLKISVVLPMFYDGRNGNFAEIMDQALTGFDMKTCRMLRRQSGSEKCQDDERLERDSSILDMRKLKSFSIAGQQSKGFTLFSRVSVIHALDPMKKRQNLSVKINGLDLEKMILERNLDFF